MRRNVPRREAVVGPERMRGPRMATRTVTAIVTRVVHFLGPMRGLRAGELLQTPARAASWGIPTRVSLPSYLFTSQHS